MREWIEFCIYLKLIKLFISSMDNNNPKRNFRQYLDEIKQNSSNSIYNNNSYEIFGKVSSKNNFNILKNIDPNNNEINVNKINNNINIDNNDNTIKNLDNNMINNKMEKTIQKNKLENNIKINIIGKGNLDENKSEEYYQELKDNENNFIYNENNIINIKEDNEINTNNSDINHNSIINNKEIRLNLNNSLNINEMNNNNIQNEEFSMNFDYQDKEYPIVDNINKNVWNDINNNRFQNRFNPLKQIYCLNCLTYNNHSTYNCPNNICKICNRKGHNINRCTMKPIICQFCFKDLNPNNGIPPHSNLFDCPNRGKIICPTKCVICKRFGHIARDCYKRK